MLIAGEADKAIDTTLCVFVCVQAYRPCAQRASILFFVLNDLGCIDPMYQFSLDAYITCYTLSIESKPPQPQTGGEDKQPQQTPHLCRLQVWNTNSHTHTHAYIYRGVTLLLCSFWSFFTVLALLCPRGWFLLNLQMPVTCTFSNFKLPFKNKFYCVLKHEISFKNDKQFYSNYFNCNKN